MGIGDVMTVVWSILGCFLTMWAAVVSAVLLFPGPTTRAQAALAQPKKALWRGTVLTATLGVLSVLLIANPLPLAKTLGVGVLFGLLTVSVIGTAGIALSLGRRIQELDPGMAAYPATVRAAAFLVGGTLTPILGWLFFAPLLLLCSLGTGWTAVVLPLSSRRAPEVA